MKIKEGKTYLSVPHEGGQLTFQHPSFRGTYGNLAQQIDANWLQRPTSAQTASLVYDALQNPKGEYEVGILKILKDFWLVEFNGNLYLPKHEGKEIHNGVIVEANPTIENEKLVMDRKALTERLNKALEDYPELKEKNADELLMDLEQIPDEIRTAVKNK